MVTLVTFVFHFSAQTISTLAVQGRGGYYLGGRVLGRGRGAVTNLTWCDITLLLGWICLPKVAFYDDDNFSWSM